MDERRGRVGSPANKRQGGASRQPWGAPGPLAQFATTGQSYLLLCQVWSFTPVFCRRTWPPGRRIVSPAVQGRWVLFHGNLVTLHPVTNCITDDSHLYRLGKSIRIYDNLRDVYSWTNMALYFCIKWSRTSSQNFNFSTLWAMSPLHIDSIALKFPQLETSVFVIQKVRSYQCWLLLPRCSCTIYTEVANLSRDVVPVT